MLKAQLTRLDQDDKQTLGVFTLFDGTDVVFQCKTLELPWLDNAQNISCIPAGDYVCKRRHSVRYGHHFKVESRHGGEVRGRENILIHYGNFHRDILGCILLGRDHIDINADGYRDVTSSRATMRQLNLEVDQILFPLHITDLTHGFK